MLAETFMATVSAFFYSDKPRPALTSRGARGKWARNLKAIIACVAGCLLFASNASAYRITVTSVSTVAGASGLSSSPVAYGATNYAIYGFSLQGNGGPPGSGTITSLTFSQRGTTTSNTSTYFTTAYLYSTTGATFTIGSATLLSSQASGSTTGITFSGLSIAMSQNTTSAYLWVVLSDNLGNTTTNTFSYYLSAFSYTATSGGTPTLNNFLSYYGPSYTFGNITLGTATTTGLASSLTASQTQAGILSFSVTSANATATISQVALSASISPSSTIGSFFSGVTIYENSTNSLTGATQLTSAVVGSLSGTTFTISGITQALSSGGTDYFFIKANYTQPATGSYTFQLSATSVTLSTAATVTGGGPIAGPSYTLVAAPLFSYTSANYYVVGSTTSLSPTSTGGPMAALGYGTGTALTSTGLNQPIGMAFDASGNLYVADYGSGVILKYAGGTGTPTTFISGLTNPTDVAFDLSGNVYVATMGGYVYKYNSGGGGQTTLVTNATMHPGSVYDIAVDASGNVFIADIKYPNVFEYIASTATTTQLINGGSGYGNYFSVYGPSGISVDAAGNFYLLNNSAGNIAEFTSSGTFIAYITTGITLGTAAGACGFFMDKGGNFYVTDPNSSSVYIYNSAGTKVATLTGFTDPRGVITDSQGNLYVSDYTNNTITKYSLTSGYTLNLGSGTTSLPPGIYFNSSTGTFSGASTVAFNGTYTVTGVNYGGSYTCSSFTINCGYPPVISYKDPGIYTKSAAVSLSAANTGSTVNSWSVSPSLPAGLSFNSTNGLISGTTSSSVTSGPSIYTVTATNNYGSGTCNVLLTVYGPPAISYPQSSYSLTVNVAVSPAIALSNTGGTVEAQNYGSPTTVLGPSTANTPAGPMGMTTDLNGNIWFTDANYLRKISTSGVETDYTLPSLPFTGVAADPYGNIYLLSENAFIYKFTVSTGVFTLFANPPAGFGDGFGLAIDPTGTYLYFTDQLNAQIFRCTINSATSAFYVSAGTYGLNSPHGIQVDAAGNIYIADWLTGKLQEYNAAGVFVQTVLTGLNYPKGLFIDNYGYIYIAGEYGDVSKYRYDGSSIWTTNFGSSKYGITVDTYGDIYVTDHNFDLLSELSPISYVLSGGALPSGISFSAVTGTFSGTPTAAFSATTYTITAYGMGSTSASTTVTLSCTYSYDWIGTISNDWNTPGNWKSLTVPGSANTAYIGVNYTFGPNPTVGVSGPTTVNVGAIQIGNSGGKAVTLTVNSGYTLAVSGNITKQSDANSLLGYISSLSGTGAITAANIVVVASTPLTQVYEERLYTDVTSLKLSGTVKLTSGFSTYAENAAFIITGGTTLATTPLTTTNAAGGTSTFYVLQGTLQLAAASPLSGLSATGTNVVTFSNNYYYSTIEYSGASQTFYTDAPVANLSNTISYTAIKFSGTGIKSPASGGGNLKITYDFTNAMANDAGNYPLLTGTPVYFDNTGTQYIVGSGLQDIYAGSGNGTVFKNITFNGSAAATIQSGMAYVNDAGTLTMSGTATLNANGKLTLVSDAGGCAAIAPITSGTPITGTVNVQRYVSAKRGYRLLSSPVYAGTVSGNKVYSINYLTSSLYLTGSGGTAGLFNAAGNPTLYLYDEGFVPHYSTFYNSNFIAISSLSSGTGSSPSYTFNTNTAGISSGNILIGNGYYCFYRGSLTSETTAQLTNPNYAGIMPATLTASGTLNQGQVMFKNWYSPASNYLGAASQNFNLIGNPYASAIDLSTIQSSSTTTGIYATTYNNATHTGIPSFIYELNPTTNIYGIYTVGGGSTYPPTNGASQYIGSGQGFFIQAYGANSSQLIFNESAKATSANANAEGLMAKRLPNIAWTNPAGQAPLLKFTMTLDSIHSEETLLAFKPDAKSTYLINEDAPHKKGEGLIGLSSMSADTIPMAINAMPLQREQIIPLNVYATNDGLYTLSLSALSPLPVLYDIWLKDAYTKDSLDIKHSPDYRFNISNADANSFGAGRFTIVIRQNPALMVHLLSFSAVGAPSGNLITWETENEANYTRFAVQRSTDGGKTFITIDTLLSNFAAAYNYIDGTPIPGANSYRLRITDINGNISYSNIVTLMYANTINGLTHNNISVYPNPANTKMNVAINAALSAGAAPSHYHLLITNNTGSVVKSITLNQTTWQSDVSGLTPGVYFITVSDAATSGVVGKSSFVKL